MKEKTAQALMSDHEQDKFYQESYIPKVHRFGTASMLLILVLSFLPAIYFSFVKGFHPGWKPILQAALTMAGIEVFTWILEPTLYFPLLGVTGSYISFVTGSITDIRVPAATAAQTVVDAKMGTKKNEFAGVIGIVSSVIVKFAVLIIVILFGDFILSILPETAVNALSYSLPSVYGTLLVMFIVRLKR